MKEEYDFSDDSLVPNVDIGNEGKEFLTNESKSNARDKPPKGSIFPV